MRQKNHHYLSRYFVFSLLFIFTLTGGFLVGVSAGASGWSASRESVLPYNSETSNSEQIDFSPFWQAWQLLDEKFVDATTTPEAVEKRLWGAISGMTEALGDPYTIFLPPTERKIFEENIAGHFGGVGIEIDLRDRVLMVISPLDGTPADRAGLRPKDKIVKIDDQSAENMSLEEAVSLIRGEIGTAVVLTVIREGESQPLNFTITREKIFIPTIRTEEEEGVFIIKLYNFGGSASAAFRSALREFIQSGGDKLLIDLRGNTGGLLETAVDLSSWFLPAGRPVVIERGRDPSQEKIHRSYGYNIFTDRLKLVILVDGGSASAAEIMAGALRDHGRSVLVGEQTFGKGSVQELVEVAGGGSLKITIARWYTPEGASLTDQGLTPDFLVEFSRDQEETGDLDLQLVKAIEILKAN